MLIGYIAIDQYNNKVVLTDRKNPRKQLLKALGVSSCRKFYTDDNNGNAIHKSYIVGSSWYDIFEIHDWNNSRKAGKNE
jgi:hypothetical protein